MMMMNIVKVHPGFSVADFKDGQLVRDTDKDNETIYVVNRIRDDGFLDLYALTLPIGTTSKRASDMEPFYGTVLIESKP